MKPVSDGYVPTFAQGYMPQKDATVIYKALSPSVTADEEALVHILPFLTPAQLTSIHHYLLNESKPSILIPDLVDKRIKSTFRDAIRAVVLGPLEFDVWLLNRATEGFGTNELFLSMVLLGRKNGDIEAIRDAYFRKYGKHLIDVIKKELSGPLEALYMDALEARRADESVPVSDSQVELDANELYTAMVGKSEGNKVSEILVTRSDAMIRKITSKYDGMSHGKSLEKMIEKKFGGGMKTALLYILHGANNRASREAKALEATMKGMGTKDEELSYRLAILHWDKDFLKLVINSYKKEFPSRHSLNARVKGETSGNYGKFLLALLEIP
ncbi:hypothetical protein Q9L58_001139 [Maublancomyces gigas]|uniref:Annexin n=1 Tax=Discina gigas TaxID=1032678 RepID=A0ABR3GV60_9PEZI